MNTQQLQCFCSVAEHLNFTRAAEELYLSVPTVTHHIQSLESELNTTLFVRSRHAVSLTESGVTFYADAKDILSKIEISKVHVISKDEEALKVVHIGLTSGAELPFLESKLKNLSAAHPSAIPEITIDSYENLIRMLKNHQLDLMLASKFMLRNYPDMYFSKFYTYKTCVILPINHKFAKKNEISVSELENERLIVLQSKEIPYSIQKQSKNPEIFSNRDYMTIAQSSSMSCLTLAYAGYGFAILPEFYIPSDINERGMTTVPLKETGLDDYGVAALQKNALVTAFYSA
ncbi:MAG: LysR family transcriptional regulator [Lachnospiraceae bacterium]|nr:LysR family transcriptional regulator [Lachnospiraceae bacterium]